jgi:hypothetical protein
LLVAIGAAITGALFVSRPAVQHAAAVDPAEAPVYGLWLADQGQQLWCLQHNRGALLWDCSTGEVLQQWTFGAGEASNTSFVASSNGVTLVSYGQGQLEIARHGELFFSQFLPHGETRVSTVHLSADGRVAAIGTERSGLIVLLIDGETVNLLPLPLPAAVDAVSCSGDGSRIAVMMAGQGLAVLDVKTLRWSATLAAPTAHCSALVWSADQTRLASSTNDGQICLWDAATGRLLWQQTGDQLDAACLVFDPQGQWLASGGFTRLVRLWAIEDGRPLGGLAGHQQPVRSLAVAPDGQTLYSGGYDGRIYAWDVARRTRIASRF